MPNWLRGMVVPTLVLWLCVLAGGLSSFATFGSEVPHRADLAAQWAFPLALAFWVTSDARKRGRRLCYDYDSFVFFAWGILVPVYLFQTRGVRAFLTLLWFAGICLIALVPLCVMIVMEELGQ